MRYKARYFICLTDNRETRFFVKIGPDRLPVWTNSLRNAKEYFTHGTANRQLTRLLLSDHYNEGELLEIISRVGTKPDLDLLYERERYLLGEIKIRTKEKDMLTRNLIAVRRQLNNHNTKED